MQFEMASLTVLSNKSKTSIDFKALETPKHASVKESHGCLVY